MASVINKLSARKVSVLNEAGYYADGGNLYLQVSKSGSKSWIFRYSKLKNGKRVRPEIGLGAFNDVSLSKAREKAATYREMIADGIDPQDEREKQIQRKLYESVSSMTFEECATKYIETHEAGWKNPKHRQQWKNTLSTYAYPTMGKLSVDLIDINHIMKVLEPIWLNKTETAKRLRGRIEKILDWATVRKFRAGENPARWKGHLNSLLTSPSKLIKVKHHEALSMDDMYGFISKLREVDGISSLALEFIILTASRTGEVREAVWSEIDLTKKIWTVPAHRMKMGKEHEVPLCDRAIHILTKMKEVQVSDYVFPGNRGKNPMSNMACTQLLRRMHYNEITVHGFRSTFRDWAAERTSYSRDVVEMALAHAIENKVEAAYRRGNLLEKRRKLMEHWQKFCELKPVIDTKVISIQGGAGNS